MGWVFSGKKRLITDVLVTAEQGSHRAKAVDFAPHPPGGAQELGGHSQAS